MPLRNIPTLSNPTGAIIFTGHTRKVKTEEEKRIVIPLENFPQSVKFTPEEALRYYERTKQFERNMAPFLGDITTPTY